MSTMVILNIVLAIFIVAAILSLLVWAIVTDRTTAVLHLTARPQRLAGEGGTIVAQTAGTRTRFERLGGFEESWEITRVHRVTVISTTHRKS